MEITVLIDNISKNTLVPEWGLAIYIEYEGHKILLDTGTTGKFVENAKNMEINLEEVEFGVLSHAHYDHADGLGEFFAVNRSAKFYLREGSKENCYKKEGFFPKYIGIHKGFLKKYEQRIIYAGGDYSILPGVMLIPHKTPDLELLGKKANMYTKINHRLQPECFAHEQSLVFDTKQGLVIFNSCSHGGADNIINEVAATFPDKKLYTLLGGFHLFKSPDEDVIALAERIKETHIQKIYTGHCTGEHAVQLLKEQLGDMVEQIYTGMSISI